MCGSPLVISNPRMNTNEHEAERGSVTRSNGADAESSRTPERLGHDHRAAAHRAALRTTEFVLIRVHCGYQRLRPRSQTRSAMAKLLMNRIKPMSTAALPYFIVSG